MKTKIKPIHWSSTRKPLLAFLPALLLMALMVFGLASPVFASAASDCGSKLNSLKSSPVTADELQTCVNAYNIVVNSTSAKGQTYCNGDSISSGSDSFMRDACFAGKDLGDAHVKAAGTSKTAAQNAAQAKKDKAAADKAAADKAAAKKKDDAKAKADAAAAKKKDDAAKAAGPSTDCTKNNCDLIAKYVNPAINLFSVAFGLIAIISVIIGAINYATSEGDPQKAGRAKNRISNTIFSIIGYLFLYSFLQFLIPGGIFNR